MSKSGVDGTSGGRNPWRLWLLLAVIAGASIRIYLMLTASVIAPDGTAYVSMARRMVTDWRAELPRDYPLGYPFLIRLTHGGFGSLFSHDPVLAWQRSGQFVALVCGTAIIVLVFFLGRKLIGDGAGLVAAWIWALLPSACALSADALSDMPTLCLVLASLLVLMRGVESGRVGQLAMAGLLSGAAYTIRPEGAEVAIVGIVSVVGIRRLSVSRRLVAALAVCVGFASIGGSYAALEGGRLINKQTWLQEERSVMRGSGDAAYANMAFLGGSNLLRPPGAVIEKTAISLRYLWFVPAVMYPFLAAARRDQRWRSGPAGMLFLLHLAILLWFQHRAGYLSHRHTMLLAVFLVVLAAGTLTELARMLAGKTGCRSLDAIAVAVGSVALSPWLLRDINSDRQYIRDASRYVERTGFNGTPNIIAQHGWVPFYAGLLNWASCPHAAALGELGDLATADIVVFDAREAVPGVIHHRPSGLEIRLDEEARFMDSHSSRGVVIYRVRR